MAIRDDYLPLDSVLPDPANYNRHSAEQVAVMCARIREVGFTAPLLVDDATKIISGGHLRRLALLKLRGEHHAEPEGVRPGWLVPCRLGEWSEIQRLKVLVGDNPDPKAIDFDTPGLADLLASLSARGELDGTGYDAARLDELIASVAAPALPTAPPIAGNGDMPDLTRADVPDALFPTDNDWTIPLLDVRGQASAVDLPVVAWGSVVRTARMPGTWHFYTGDERYTALWSDPSPVANSACVNAVEPNFSIYDQMPRAVALYRIYQKRWIARFWQSLGIRIFADLNVAEPHADLNLLGIPDGWRAWATRGYEERMDATEREHGLACARAGTDDLLFLVYGGGKAVADLCGRHGWVHIQERMTVAREARRG
jgi:hypothetical protein